LKKGRMSLRRFAGLTTFAAALVTLLVMVPLAVAAAVNTTDDPGQTVNGTLTLACLHGQSPSVNCNIYAQKEDVFLSGSPTPASLDPGTYYFAVVSPGGQPDPNPGAADLLSNDAAVQREFSINSSGVITNLGNHFFDSAHNKLSVWPYDNTPNPGGVYILAVCLIGSGQGAAIDPVPTVVPKDCKYDAFKVRPPATPTASAPTIIKDATPSFGRSFAWSITKDPSATHVDTAGASANITYTVKVTPTGHTDTYSVGGTITVSNDNSFAVHITSLSDVVQYDNAGTATDDTNAHCSITSISDGTNTYTVPFDLAGTTTVDAAYNCTYSAAPAANSETNIASVNWDADAAHQLNAGPASFSLPFSFPSTPALSNECVDVTDKYTAPNPTTETKLATLCVNAAGALQTPGSSDINQTYSNGSPVSVALKPVAPATPTYFELTYTKGLAATAGVCIVYDNTATFTSTDDHTVTGSDDAEVTVCGPAITSALTMGFWKGPNGQNLIQYYGAGLFAWFNGFLPLSSVDSLADVNTVFKNASATNMNNMLKAQMLATALGVYFSDPALGYTTTNKIVNGKTIKAPSNFLTHGLLGGFSMDLTAICPMVDNTTTGTAICKNNTPSTDGVASGAFPSSPHTVLWILGFASTLDSSPWANGAYSGNNIWYGGNRTLEEILKNTFDQINNNVAFAG
jgi:hypothetical protein